MHRRPATSCFLATVAVALCSCAGEAPLVDVTGDCAALFASEVCTWARVQGANVVEVGATVPMAAIESAPADAAMAWPPVATAELNLPESARAGSGVRHLTVYWEPHGHPPGPYMVPHFDFHFYTITPEERMAIDCVDSAKPSELPAGYGLPDVELPAPIGLLPGLCIQGMGMHALLNSELQSEKSFRGTMVVGYNNGKPIFVEPMLTREMLMERRSFDLTLPSIPGMSAPHPTVFRADYDPEKQAYRFVFSRINPAS